MYPYREYFEAKVYTIWAHGPLGNSIFRQKKTQTAQRRLPIQMQAPGWSPRDNTGDDQAAGPLFQDPYTYIYIYVSYIYIYIYIERERGREREREIGRKGGERERVIGCCSVVYCLVPFGMFSWEVIGFGGLGGSGALWVEDLEFGRGL